MRKIVIASDSFKGSLSSAEVAACSERAVHRLLPDCEVVDVVFRTNFAGHVVVADDVGGSEIEFLAQPRRQPQEARHRLGGELARLIRVADLDGNGVIVRLRGAVGDLRERDALEDLALQPHDEVGAGIGLVREGKVGEEAAVCRRRGAGVSDVVDDHAVDRLERRAGTGIRVERQDVLLHPFRRGHVRAGNGAVAEPVDQLRADAENEHGDDRPLEALAGMGIETPTTARGF